MADDTPPLPTGATMLPPLPAGAKWQSSPPASPTKPAAVTPGEQQFQQDKALVEKAAGLVPGELKAGTYSALNTFLLNAPSHVVAAVSSLSEGKPYMQSFEEQKRYEDALSRQYPVSSGIGTAAGLGASLLTPIGVGGAALRGAGLGAKALASAGIGSVMGGAAGYLEHLDPTQGLVGAGLGAGLGAAGEGVASGLSKYLAKAPAVLDAAGNPTQETLSALKSAFGDRLSPEDAKAFLGRYGELSQKAVSPEAAMRQALLEHAGVEQPTRSMVTGEKVSPAAAGIRSESQEQAGSSIYQKAQELAQQATPVGATSPVFGELAEKFHTAGYAGQQSRTATYNRMKSLPGEFDDAITQDFIPKIQETLKKGKFPTSFAGEPDYPIANQALDYLSNGLAAGNYPLSYEPLNLNNIEQVRSALNGFWAKASGKDRVAIDSIKEGFDTAVSQSLQSGAFSGDATAAAKALTSARRQWSDFTKTFYPETKSGVSGNKINQISKSLADSVTGRFGSTPDAAAVEAAQKILDSGLADPKISSAFYDRLEKVFGSGSNEMSLINRNVRDAILDTNGDVSKLPQNIDSFLSKNLGLSAKTFSPDEISELRRLSEAVKTINQKPIPAEQKSSLFADLAGSLSAGIGPAVLAHLAGFGTFGSAATYVGGGLLSGVGKYASREFPKAVEKKGAEAYGLGAAPDWSMDFANKFRSAIGDRGVGPVGLSTGAAGAAHGTPEEYEYQAPQPLTIYPNRPGRKSGGSVSIADRLISEVDRAKRGIDSKTKTLLGAHDDHVAYALALANKNIEA